MVNLTNDLYSSLTELEGFVKERVNTGKELGLYCKAVSKTAFTPFTTLKQAVFLHMHLHHAITFNPQKAIDFINLLLCRCESVVELYGDGECVEQFEVSKCAVTRSQATTREDEIFQGKEVFLVSKIIRPYLYYLQRLVTSFS